MTKVMEKTNRIVVKPTTDCRCSICGSKKWKDIQTLSATYDLDNMTFTEKEQISTKFACAKCGKKANMAITFILSGIRRNGK